MWRIITNDDKKSIPSNIRGITNIVGGGYYEMTKKFWNDWKRRFGETEQVYIARQKCAWHDYENSLRYSHGLLALYRGERILSHKFNGNTIELVIERKIYTKGGPWPLCYHYETQNECVTIYRKDIVSVTFKNYNTEGNTKR